MRWLSSKESVRKGEPSVLAIVETLLAMGGSLWIALHFGTATHILIGACIAPFLLLRTDASAMRGVQLFIWVTGWAHGLLGRNARRAAVGALSLGFSYVAVRAYAVVVTAVRNPTATLRAIPENWQRTVVATDLCRPPQFVALPDMLERAEGVLSSGGRSPDIYWLFGLVFGRDGRRRLKERRQHVILRILHSLAGTLFLGTLALPPVIYRLSLKSTAIIWFPLLWALRPLGPRDASLNVRLRLFEKSDIRRLVLRVSTLALLLFTGKLVFWNELAQASDTWNASTGGRILTIHIAPGVVAWWQLATALNSIIAIVLWLYLRSWLRHVEAGVPRREETAESLLTLGLFVRRLLTSYTILCVGYLYLCEASTWRLPALGGKPFPWM